MLMQVFILGLNMQLFKCGNISNTLKVTQDLITIACGLQHSTKFVGIYY